MALSCSYNLSASCLFRQLSSQVVPACAYCVILFPLATSLPSSPSAWRSSVVPADHRCAPAICLLFHHPIHRLCLPLCDIPCGSRHSPISLTSPWTDPLKLHATTVSPLLLLLQTLYGMTLPVCNHVQETSLHPLYSRGGRKEGGRGRKEGQWRRRFTPVHAPTLSWWHFSYLRHHCMRLLQAPTHAS